MFRRHFLLFAGLALFSTGVSQAGGIKDKFIYTPYIGYHIFSCKREGKVGNNFYDLKDTLVGGASFEKVFTNFGIGILGDYGQSTLEGTNVDRDSYDWAVFGSYYENAEDRLIPFVSLGVGGNFMNHKTLTGIFGAAGLRYVFSDNFGLKIAVQDFYLWKGRHDIVPVLGLDILFGGVSDADKDGIPDDKDRCPDTPAGVKVNSIGCPLDTDKDGVPDYKDKCPDTPEGISVDLKGCPLDSDKDGVPDYMDRCPDTPEGVSVDKKGCPLDSDRDGVPDYKDRCPDTPAGVKVNSIGCPLDTDKDGVPDYKDKCPDTPEGVSVDLKGCPLDSDKDGVPDYMDRCPNTPEGYKVDEKGCFVEVKLEVHFDSDKAIIKPEYYPVIEKFARFLKENPNIKVEIQGHTDSTGSEKYNLILSQKRAEAVKRILVEKYGISPERIIAKGYGESQPIAPNDTEEGKAKNRRVIAKIIK